jgi:hypothetical protein
MQERVAYETTWVSLTALGHLNYASSQPETPALVSRLSRARP